MTDIIIHRGPDEAGVWESPDLSLGTRRLAIVDLETGQQPIFNEDATVGVVFNGEIYNYPELQAELKGQGHRFHTDHSDTEVLVHLYEQYGDEFLHKLNGMFAIALWDIPRQRLLLARDRVGIKPLYYSMAGGARRGTESTAENSCIIDPGGKPYGPTVHCYFIVVEGGGPSLGDGNQLAQPGRIRGE